MSEGKTVDKGQYKRLVVKLIYLDAAYRIMRYLKKTPGKGLFFTRHDDRQVHAFTNADWAESISDRKSTSWYSKKKIYGCTK